MAFNVEVFALLTYIAVTLTIHCGAVCPPPPTKLRYDWLDPFTVNVSWEKPRGFRTTEEVTYKYSLVKNRDDKSKGSIKGRNVTEMCLTEELDSDNWTISVWTDGSQSCNSSSKIQRSTISFKNKKPHAQVVRDFKCLIHGNETKCSWIPLDPSQNLRVAYRICGRFDEREKGLKNCTGMRTDCRLEVDITHGDICVLTETEAGMSTFKANLEVPSPKLSVREEGNRLRLNWERPEVGQGCHWIYELCYTKCSNSKECSNYTVTETMKPTVSVAYDENCQYQFHSRVTSMYCKKISSGFTKVVIYGTNKPPDGTMTVVAIVIPIVLSLCVLLSCYCFRRHSAIICPNIPDPSAIFKEMMMNGNKELKTTATGSLYTPVPEPIEPCRITPVNENIVPQANI